MLIDLIRSGRSATEVIYLLVVVLISMTLAFSFHEFMHAVAATWCGDNTARNRGRLTLNPLAHIDPIGTLCIVLVGFGWGKPVPYNPNNLNRIKSKVLMRQMVHLAGVTGNFILALVFTLISSFLIVFANASTPFVNTIFDVCTYSIELNLMLMAFNLIPIPPLDGFHVLEEFLPIKTKYTSGYKTFVTKGPQILWIVVLISNFSGLRLFSLIINVIEIPARFVLELLRLLIFTIFA
ncbi:MAG: site-2 protease family protein [Saccharofermentans sp.]|nr:site-2 protease family protein [Saccharofermentans sp.]